MRFPISRSLPALCGTLLGTALFGWLGGLDGGAAIALGSVRDFEACPPPAEDEYLLLTMANLEGDRTAALDAIDDDFPTQTCLYLDEVVVRVSGFSDRNEATDLARTLTTDFGLSAFVTRLPDPVPDPQFEPRPYGEALELPEVQVVEARPGPGSSTTSAPTATPAQTDDTPTDETPDESDATADASDEEEALPVFTPADMPPPQMETRDADDRADRVPPPNTRGTDARADRVPPPSGRAPRPSSRQESRSESRGEFVDDGVIQTPFTPQLLAEGYVVLVDYFNDPSVAAEVAAITEQAVGLVSYGRRPFLMADFTMSESEANATLAALSDAGLYPLVVDSRRAVLLVPRVDLDH